MRNIRARAIRKAANIISNKKEYKKLPVNIYRRLKIHYLRFKDLKITDYEIRLGTR